MTELENPKVVGSVLGVIGFTLVIALLIIPSFAGKDTQFFVTNTVNATDIALGDLTDVTLINTLNNQILVYNSTSNLWENENQTSISTSNATCSNLGSGKILCASYSGNNLALKSLLAGSAITLSNDTNTITITNAGVWHDIAGTGISVNQTSGNVLISNIGVLKDIAGAGISVNQTTGNVLITNTLPESTVCNNSTSNAGHMGLCKNNTISLRTLLAGSGISLSLNSTDIIITNSGIISNSCGIGINCSGTNPATFNTDFVNGTGISITGSTSQTFTNTGLTSLSANSPLSASASTGSVTLSCPTCITTSINPISLLCHNSLSGSATSLSCSSFTAKKHLHIVITYELVTNSVTCGLQFNSDTGTNYSDRQSLNGGADTTDTTATNIKCGSNISAGRSAYVIFDCNNITALNKSCVGFYVSDVVNSNSASNRQEQAGTWFNTASQITTITLMRYAGTGSYTSNTSIDVFGWD